jgi:hypothetical protein
MAGDKAPVTFPIVVPLTEPVEDFGRPVTELRISRRPRGSDMVEARRQGAKEIDLTMLLIERLCGVSRAAALNLCLEDIAAFEGAIQPFCG